MNVQVDGKEYPISMTWHQDNSLEHFVLIDDEWINLQINWMADLKGKRPKSTHAEERKLFTERVKEILDVRQSVYTDL